MKTKDKLLISFLILMKLHLMNSTSQFMPGMSGMAMNNSKDLELFQKVFNNMQMLNSLNGYNPNIFQSLTQSNQSSASLNPSQLVIYLFNSKTVNATNVNGK
jgi:hypothetical protein